MIVDELQSYSYNPVYWLITFLQLGYFRLQLIIKLVGQFE